jgi:hypothetical protein
VVAKLSLAYLAENYIMGKGIAWGNAMLRLQPLRSKKYG